MSIIIESVQTFCVIVVLSYLLSRTNFFTTEDYDKKLSVKKLLLAIVIFLVVSLYGKIAGGVYKGNLHIDTRIAGIVLAGLIFGYKASFGVMIPVAVYSLITGGETIIADCIGMLLAAFLSGFCKKRFKSMDAIFSGIIVGTMELVHMLLIVFTLRPIEHAKEIVYSISFPMIILNGCAVILFVLIIQDINTRRILWQKQGSVQSELEIAKRIQRSLLPKDFTINPKLDMAAFLEPAKDVGGDLYNFCILDGNTFVFILGDVSGKGIPASLEMSRTMALFGTEALNRQTPSKILEIVNRALADHNDAQMFVTAIAGSLNLDTGHLIYSNAGHTQPYLVRDGKVISMPKPKGMPLGVFADATYADEETELGFGEYMVMYTDGVTEASNIGGALYGNERLESTLSTKKFEDAADLIDTVRGDVTGFAKGAEQSDDIAILTIGVRNQVLGYHLRNKLEDLMEFEKKLNEDLTDREIAKSKRDDICLVTEELITNIIKYGYPDSRDGYIDVEADCTGGNVSLTFVDDSDSFNQFSHDSDAILNIPAAKRSQGGLGIGMLKKRTEDYSYTSEAGKNITRFTMKEEADYEK